MIIPDFTQFCSFPVRGTITRMVLSRGVNMPERRKPQSRPHDNFFWNVFPSPMVVKDLLRNFLPGPLVAQMDVDRLKHLDGKFVDENLRGHFVDMLLSVPMAGVDALVYVLLQHKSYPDRWTALQMLRYMMRIWQEWHSQHPKAKVLPAIIPVVLYHGRKGWKRLRHLHPLSEAFRPSSTSRPTSGSCSLTYAAWI